MLDRKASEGLVFETRNKVQFLPETGPLNVQFLGEENGRGEHTSSEKASWSGAMATLRRKASTATSTSRCASGRFCSHLRQSRFETVKVEDSQGLRQSRPDSDLCTFKTAKARFWPLLAGKSP